MMRYRSTISTNIDSGYVAITFIFVIVGISAMFNVEFKGVFDLSIKQLRSAHQQRYQTRNQTQILCRHYFILLCIEI
jgi:hypothetical protein